MNHQVFEKFPRPPIKEAILILNFEESLTLDDLKEFAKFDAIRKKYPITQNLIEHSFTFNTQKGKASTSLQNLEDGVILQTAETNPEFILQVKRKSLSLHKIQDYTSWENLIAELKTFLQLFTQKMVSTIKVKEIGVRYINHIAITFKEPLNSYFNLLPTTVEGIPANLNKFFLQLGVADKGMNGIIIESILSTNNIPHFVIDLRVTMLATAANLSDDKMWEDFNRIRHFKNQLFFSIITDKTKELFR